MSVEPPPRAGHAEKKQHIEERLPRGGKWRRCVCECVRGWEESGHEQLLLQTRSREGTVGVSVFVWGAGLV